MLLRRLTLQIGLLAAAIGGIVAACYGELPGPSGPLPPTREVTPIAPKPGPLQPVPVRADTDAGVPLPAIEPEPSSTRVIATQTRIAPAPAHDVRDAGVADTLSLPPVPDANITIDAPVVKKSND